MKLYFCSKKFVTHEDKIVNSKHEECIEHCVEKSLIDNSILCYISDTVKVRFNIDFNRYEMYYLATKPIFMDVFTVFLPFFIQFTHNRL